MNEPAIPPTSGKPPASGKPATGKPATGNEKVGLTVTVNDQPIELSLSCTVADLLVKLPLRGGPVAVELNQQLIPSTKLDETILQNGDTLEVVSLTGGG